jgi:hypothetical protein
MANKIGVRTPVSAVKTAPNTRVGADLLLRQIRGRRSKLELDYEPLLPAYVVSVCAAVEHRLNEAYVKHFHALVGYGYEPYVAPYLRLRMEEKLGMLVPLISQFKLEVDRKSANVAYLFKLFRLRNRLIHQVPHLVRAEFEWVSEHSALMHYPQNEFRHAHSHPEWETVRRSDLVRIHAALNFWMRWTWDIATRINNKRFNHQGILKPISKGK